jgi:DNA-binding Lrp family transcriptional regulator
MEINDNEMAVLRAIVENPRISNKAIAKSLGLSSAGIGKIRNKLEEKGIIDNYKVQVDFNAAGLEAFGIIHIRVTAKGWKYKGSTGVQAYIISNPNVVGVYRVPGRQITHILLCAFRSIKEMDAFLHIIQAQLAEYIEVVESYMFSGVSIIKDSFKDLILKIIDEGKEKRMPEPVLFGSIMGEEE